MYKKEAKDFDTLNTALVYAVLEEMQKKYVDSGVQLTHIVSKVTPITFNSDMLPTYFETGYRDNLQKTAHTVFGYLLETQLENIDNGHNKYRKFKRLTERMYLDTDTVRTEFNLTVPITLLFLEPFLLYMLKGATYYETELLKESSKMVEELDYVTKAFICLYHLSTIRGVSKKRGLLELMASQLLLADKDNEDYSPVLILFDILQEGYC